jgi:hypothetical protein
MFTDYVVPRRMGSEPRMRARTLVAAIAVVALAAAGIVAGTMVYLYGNPWGSGPLRATGWIDKALITRSGAAATFSGPKLYNTGRRPIIIDRIEPQSRTEIDDAEFTVDTIALVSTHGVESRVGALPTTGDDAPRAVAGAVLPSGRPGDFDGTVVIQLTVTGLGAGGIDRLVIDYHVGPFHYETWAYGWVIACTSRIPCDYPTYPGR